MRRGPPPEEGAARIVVLGDSVAFGYGLADDETYAHRLEDFLAGTLASGAPRPAVWTVACPGWNWRSSFRYLRNHLDRLDPDVVLYVAVDNDLDDISAVDELGRRRIDVHPGADRPQCSHEAHMRLLRTLTSTPSRARLLEVLAAGGPRVVEYALVSGLTPESERRWRDFVEGVEELRDHLAARGTRLAVVLPFDDDFHRLAELRLLRALPDLPLLGLFSGPLPEDTLGVDPHPNARCVRAGARCMAELLIERGWIPGTVARPLPPQDDAYRARAMQLLTPGEREAFQHEHRELLGRFLGDAIDLDDALGIHQVYGGLIGDGTVGAHVYACLAGGGGERLKLVLERLPAESAVYPLSLSVEVQGRAVGTSSVPPPTSGEDRLWEVELPLPAELAGEAYLDVLIRASNHVEADGRDGRRPLSFRLRRLALE